MRVLVPNQTTADPPVSDNPERDHSLASTGGRVTAKLRWAVRWCRPRRALAAAHRLFRDGPIEALHKTKLYVQRSYASPRALPVQATARKAPGSASGFVYRPLISVIVPVFDVPSDRLRRVVASVQAQTYPHWELCLCDDGSTDPGTISALLNLEQTEPRSRLRRLSTHSGISSATNEALLIAKGEFAAFLDQGGELAPHALEACVAALNGDSQIEALYTDEARLDHQDQPMGAVFKPDWSPALLREAMYIGHLLVIRRSVIENAGGFDPFYDGVQSFELMLRLSEQAHRIHHLRDVLYHCRSDSDGADTSPVIAARQVAAVNAHLSRLGLAAQAEPHPDLPLRVIVRPLARQSHAKVSIIVVTHDKPESVSRCLASIYDMTSHPNFEVVLVDTETADLDAEAAIDRFPVIRVPFAGRYHFASANKAGVAASSGEVLVFLTPDTEVLHRDWLDQMVFLLNDPGVAAVGPMLLNPDHTVQPAGVRLPVRGSVDHLPHDLPASAGSHFDSLACTREVSAVSLTCVMVSRSDFDAVGGLQDLYSSHCQDVDFCLRLQEQGRRILYTPRTRLIHHHDAASGPGCDPLDLALLLDAWGTTVSASDPYACWNPAHPAKIRTP